MTQVSFCTQQMCAPPKASFSQTVGNVDKAQWQTHNVPNDSGERETMTWKLMWSCIRKSVIHRVHQKTMTLFNWIPTSKCLSSILLVQPGLEQRTVSERISRLAKLSGNSCSFDSISLSTGHLCPASLYNRQKLVLRTSHARPKINWHLFCITNMTTCLVTTDIVNMCDRIS